MQLISKSRQYNIYHKKLLGWLGKIINYTHVVVNLSHQQAHNTELVHNIIGTDNIRDDSICFGPNWVHRDDLQDFIPNIKSMVYFFLILKQWVKYLSIMDSWRKTQVFDLQSPFTTYWNMFWGYFFSPNCSSVCKQNKKTPQVLKIEKNIVLAKMPKLEKLPQKKTQTIYNMCFWSTWITVLGLPV